MNSVIIELLSGITYQICVITLEIIPTKNVHHQSTLQMSLEFWVTKKIYITRECFDWHSDYRIHT